MSVEELQASIDILHNGFLISLMLTVVFLALTVLLFFRFDMNTVFRQMLGFEAKQRIAQFNKNDAATQNLQESLIYNSVATKERTPLGLTDGLRNSRRSGSLSGQLRGKSRRLKQKLEQQLANAEISSTEVLAGNQGKQATAQATPSANASAAEAQAALREQAVLQAQAAVATQAMPTVVSAITDAMAQGAGNISRPVARSDIADFKVLKDLLVVHTEERMK